MTMIPVRWRPAFLLCALAVFFVSGAPNVLGDGDFSRMRAQMIQVIEAHQRGTLLERHGEAFDPRVLDVMGQTPRHLFVPESKRNEAYADRPLPIGYGQTISQPFIVAFMTHMLKPEPDHVVLEVGTGSGYQAAVLAPLVHRVCTIEIIPELGESARQRLEEQGYDNVRTRVGDGYYGWEDCGPFDSIVVTAAGNHLPPPLIEQLKPDGRLIMPVGGPFVMQHLVLATKGADERLYTRNLLPVAFVPLRREAE
jgi:protein-L-isoaspartate(D-aspartate) O-methyltransferase